MTRMSSHVGWLLAIALVCSTTIPAPVSGQETATDPESADEYLEAFNELEGNETFEEYSEFEVIRAQSVSSVQIGDFSDEKAERIRIVYEMLITFEEAYELSQNGSRAESIETANETAALARELRDRGGEQYATLAELALERFYLNQGEALHESAQETNETRATLSLMNSAATAYQRAGASDEYSSLVVQRERLRTAFVNDIETLNDTTEASYAFLENCADDCGSPTSVLETHSISVFSKYASARENVDKLDAAAEITADHGLVERRERVASMRERTESAVVSFALASVILMLGVTLAIALVAMVVAHRLAAWARDIEDANVGNIVTEEVIDE